MKYSENYQVSYDECDENQHLKLSALIDLLLRVSEHQLAGTSASTKELNKRNIGWVVTQYHFEVKAWPRPLEHVVLTTDASGYNRFFEYRDFEVADEAGQVLIAVRSSWVLFDIAKRKMISTEPEMMASLDIPLLKKMPSFPRLRGQKQYDDQRSYRVRYDDLDTNHHLTNGHYFNWFIDMLNRDFLKNNVVNLIDIKFNQEVGYGQELYSCVSVVDDAGKTKSYHAIKDDAGKVRAVCEMAWRKVD